MVLLRPSISQNESDDNRNVRNAFGTSANEINTVQFMSHAVKSMDFGVHSIEINDTDCGTDNNNNTNTDDENSDDDGEEDDDDEHIARTQQNCRNSINPKPIKRHCKHIMAVGSNCDIGHFSRFRKYLRQRRRSHSSNSLTQLFSIRRWCTTMHFDKMHLPWIILWYLLAFGIQATLARPNTVHDAATVAQAAPVVAATTATTSKNGVSTPKNNDF